MMRGQFAVGAGLGRIERLASGFGGVVGRIAALVNARAATGPVVALLALLLPQMAQANDTPKRGGTLEFASTVEPGNYDCHGNTSFAFLHPVAPHYSTLLKFDAANYPQIVGDLAQSWTVSPDRQTYTFKLRPNVLFHDGSRLTSADIEASYQRIAHPPAIAQPDWPRTRNSRRRIFLEPVHSCLSSIEGRELAGQALGQVLPARQTLSRWL